MKVVAELIQKSIEPFNLPVYREVRPVELGETSPCSITMIKTEINTKWGNGPDLKLKGHAKEKIS